jgi:hypothetical protein
MLKLPSFLTHRWPEFTALAILLFGKRQLAYRRKILTTPRPVFVDDAIE